MVDDHELAEPAVDDEVVDRCRRQGRGDDLGGGTVPPGGRGGRGGRAAPVRRLQVLSGGPTLTASGPSARTVRPQRSRLESGTVPQR
jgi:hypothetical protein